MATVTLTSTKRNYSISKIIIFLRTILNIALLILKL